VPESRERPAGCEPVAIEDPHRSTKRGNRAGGPRHMPNLRRPVFCLRQELRWKSKWFAGAGLRASGKDASAAYEIAPPRERMDSNFQTRSDLDRASILYAGSSPTSRQIAKGQRQVRPRSERLLYVADPREAKQS